MNSEAVSEFATYFSKTDLEGEVLNLEECLRSSSPEKAEVVQSFFRELHSLKGTAGMLNLETFVLFLHAYEDALGVVSNNIHSVSGIRKNEIFDFFLQGLDLIEKLIEEFRENEEVVLKDQKQLFSFYIRMMVEADNIKDSPEEYLYFQELDEDLF